MTETTTTTCRDCGVAPGQRHEDGCDVARCLVTGEQRLQCGDEDFPDGEHPGLDCGEDIWTGKWPGEAECREYGWWVRWSPPRPQEKYGAWVPVPAGHPEANPDLNRLHRECNWDRDAQRWVRRAASDARA